VRAQVVLQLRLDRAETKIRPRPHHTGAPDPTGGAQRRAVPGTSPICMCFTPPSFLAFLSALVCFPCSCICTGIARGVTRSGPVRIRDQRVLGSLSARGLAPAETAFAANVLSSAMGQGSAGAAEQGHLTKLSLKHLVDNLQQFRWSQGQNRTRLYVEFGVAVLVQAGGVLLQSSSLSGGAPRAPSPSTLPTLTRLPLPSSDGRLGRPKTPKARTSRPGNELHQLSALTVSQRYHQVFHINPQASPWCRCVVPL
jgi:hypothetical protein